MKFLLDTNVCIDAMRGRANVLNQLAAQSPDDCAVSTITSYELMVGVSKCRHPKREQSKVDALLELMHETVFDRDAALHAARLRADLESKGTMIGPYDVLIAAQAISKNLILVTANTGEFKHVDNLRWQDWSLAV